MDPLARINAAFGVYRSGPMLNGDGNAGGGGSGGGQGSGTGGGAGGGTAGATGGTTGSSAGASGQGGGEGTGSGQGNGSTAGGTGNGSQTITITKAELETNYAGLRRETERTVRQQMQRETAETAETERTEAERKAAEERGEYDTVKNGLISERDTLKGQVTEQGNELKDLRALAQQQFDDLTKDLPDPLKAMIPDDTTPLMKRIESAKSARAYHDEHQGGTGGSGGRGTQGGGNNRGTGHDPKPNGDGNDDSGIKIGIGLFGRNSS